MDSLSRASGAGRGQALSGDISSARESKQRLQVAEMRGKLAHLIGKYFGVSAGGRNFEFVRQLPAGQVGPMYRAIAERVEARNGAHAISRMIRRFSPDERILRLQRVAEDVAQDPRYNDELAKKPPRSSVVAQYPIMHQEDAGFESVELDFRRADDVGEAARCSVVLIEEDSPVAVEFVGLNGGPVGLELTHLTGDLERDEVEPEFGVKYAQVFKLPEPEDYEVVNAGESRNVGSIVALDMTESLADMDADMVNPEYGTRDDIEDAAVYFYPFKLPDPEDDEVDVEIVDIEPPPRSS